MNERIKKALAGVLLVCMLAVFMPARLLVSMAASGNIIFSAPSGAVGQQITVNMKITTSDGSLSSADVMLAYDANALEFISGNSVEGGAGALRARGGPDAADPSTIVFSMEFQALTAGTSQITITSQEVYDINAQMVTINHLGNSTITVSGDGETGETAAEGQLTALSISPGTLTPAFSPSIDSYSANVGMDVESIDVQALAGEGSTVTVEGSEGLQMGENTVTIRVTAPDGTVKTYTISVTKSEGGETAAAETEAVEGVSLEAAAKAITILEPEEGVAPPEGFVEAKINIDGHEVTGWIWENESDHQYCIFYAANAAGEKNLYRYDLTEKTIQRYFQDPAAQASQEEYVTLAENYNNLLEDYQIRLYIIIALIAVAVVLLIIVIVLLASKKSDGSNGPRKPENDKDDLPERKPVKKISREERYMRDEEDEEDNPGEKAEAKTSSNDQEVVQWNMMDRDFEEIPMEDLDVVQIETAVSASPEPTPAQTAERTKEEKEPKEDEDDDFEFIDIDLS